MQDNATNAIKQCMSTFLGVILLPVNNEN